MVYRTSTTQPTYILSWEEVRELVLNSLYDRDIHPINPKVSIILSEDKNSIKIVVRGEDDYQNTPVSVTDPQNPNLCPEHPFCDCSDNT